MNRPLKITLQVFIGLCATLGALVFVASAFTFTFFFCTPSNPSSHEPRNHIGENCVNSDAWRKVPIPEQSAAELPMVVETAGIDYSGFIVFAADEEWRQHFCKLHTGPNPHDMVDAGQALRLAEQVKDKRFANFISSREWTLFHKSRVWPKTGWYVNAMVDTSGEHVLLYYYTF